MNQGTLDPDPDNPQGMRTRSLRGSGTHDEDMSSEGGLWRDDAGPAGGEAPREAAEEAGAGDTLLVARLRAAARLKGPGAAADEDFTL